MQLSSSCRWYGSRACLVLQKHAHPVPWLHVNSHLQQHKQCPTTLHNLKSHHSLVAWTSGPSPQKSHQQGGGHKSNKHLPCQSPSKIAPCSRVSAQRKRQSLHRLVKSWHSRVGVNAHTEVSCAAQPSQDQRRCKWHVQGGGYVWVKGFLQPSVALCYAACCSFQHFRHNNTKLTILQSPLQKWMLGRATSSTKGKAKPAHRISYSE